MPAFSERSMARHAALWMPASAACQTIRRCAGPGRHAPPLVHITETPAHQVTGFEGTFAAKYRRFVRMHWRFGMPAVEWRDESRLFSISSPYRSCIVYGRANGIKTEPPVRRKQQPSLRGAGKLRRAYEPEWAMVASLTRFLGRWAWSN